MWRNDFGLSQIVVFVIHSLLQALVHVLIGLVMQVLQWLEILRDAGYIITKTYPHGKDICVFTYLISQ